MRKGKSRLASVAAKLQTRFPERLLTITRDGRKFVIDPRSPSYRDVYYSGEYEPGTTKIVGKLVKSGDVCVDAGAHIGWYSTLMQKLVGSTGRVYAFEPLPSSFASLRENTQLNAVTDNISIANAALGEVEKQTEILMFDDLPDGHASLSRSGQTRFHAFSVPMITLDSFISNNAVREVTFIKADVEGAELSLLRGASSVFRQARPPIFEIEMALATTRHFDYLPNDLISFINSRRAYDFFRIEETNGNLKKFAGFSPPEIGANVLCVPKGFYTERLAGLRITD